MISSIHPIVNNLIENPTLHYKLSVGELGPDNPAKASESIGRVSIHEMVNYLSMKKRAIDNCEDVVYHSIDLHFVKAGSFIAADSGKTTVYTEKSKRCNKSKITNKISKEDGKDVSKNGTTKDKKTESKDSKKIDRAITVLNNVISFYKSKLQSDPKNPYYSMKVRELENKLLSLQMSKIQDKMMNLSSKLTKGSISDAISSLLNGELLNATA